MTHVFTIALAGQPNVGKSTVFNLLTGEHQHVGNWPGKTCEQRIGFYHHNGLTVRIVDLPGAYSLSANSEDERIARDFIIRDEPDVIVVIVNAAALERDLYLLAELLILPRPVVVGLNMLDVARQSGALIEPHVLAAALGLPVVPMVASRGEGLPALMAEAIRLAQNAQPQTPNRPEIRRDHQKVLDDIQNLIAAYVPPPYPPDWTALKLLEGDAEITALLRQQMGPAWSSVETILRQHDDAFLAVVSGRYEWIARMVRAAVVQPQAGQLTLTDRLDRLATHPIGGLLFLLGALAVLFWLTYAIGAPLQAWLETHLVQAAARLARQALSGSPTWLAGMVADGVISGAGTVLTLLPILVIFFAGLGLLEDLGYMARAAYVMDRFMHLMGLHGKSFLPLFLGFGCNVPAVMGARIIESPKARLITILVSPIVPCTARLSVVAFLAPLFFGAHAMWVSWGLIGLNLLALALVGIVLHELFLGGEHTPFIMELPLYHKPNLGVIARILWQRLADFLVTAGSIILVVSIILWALSNFPNGNIETSYLAGFGRLLTPIGRLMGLDWQMMVAMLTSFVRKENTISTLAVLYSGQEGGLNAALTARLTPAAGLAFLAVQMLFIPCVATVAAIQHETRSWRWTLTSILLLLLLSFAAGIGIYQGVRLFGWGV